MSTTAAVHPTDETLHSHGLGSLDQASADSVDKHLEGCADCRRRVAAMASDTTHSRLREALGQPGSTGHRVSSLDGLSMLDDDANQKPPPADSLPPGLADHQDYEVIRELGHGGMGTVYLAKNRLMGRHEVLKVVSKHMMNRPAALERFLSEIRHAARLHHTNIVTAYSATRVGESIVFAMEYVEGLDLSRLVKAKGPLPVANACHYIHQAALGLQHASEIGMVHRDIKPSNLMLAKQGNRGVVKVLDFGLAKVKSEGTVDGSLTHDGQFLGTPEYVAPEQISNARHADIRADIYSLGCTFYYVLTGTPPFRAASLYDLLQAHHSMDALPLNLARPAVPFELAALVAKMMAKEPERRFQTPKDVAQVLLPFFKGGVVAITAPKADMSGPGRDDEDRALMRAIEVAVRQTPQTPPPSVAPPLETPSARPRTEPAWERLIEFKESEPLAEPISAVTASTRPPRRIRPLVAAAGLLLLGVIVASAVMIRVNTLNGVIVVENVPEGAAVEVDREKITVTPKGGAPVTIEAHAGEHDVMVKRGDDVLLGRSVRLGSGKTLKLKVTYEPSSGPSPGHNGQSADDGSPPSGGAPESKNDLALRDAVPGDKDRRAAESVLSGGGSVAIRVNGQEQTCEPGTALPTQAFQLTQVLFREQPQLTDAALEPFEGLTNLVVLSLKGCRRVTDAGVAHLRSLPRLESLRLDGTGVTDAGLVHLKGLPKLTTLNIGWTGVTNAGLVHLESMSGLRLLALGRTRVTDAGLLHLRGLGQLRDLWLEETRVGDAGLVYLRDLTKLRQLLLWHTRVTDAGLVHLQRLPQLEGLMLGGTPVTDTGLARLGGLARLKSLWLDGTRVTDAGLVHLQALTQLEVLNLDRTPVTDTGLVHLPGLTRLQELHLRGTGLTAAGVEGLKKMLPACQISADFAALEKPPGSSAYAVPSSAPPAGGQKQKLGLENRGGPAEDGGVFLSDMRPSSLKMGRSGHFSADGTLGKSKEKIRIKGVESPHGLFLHPPFQGHSEVTYTIDGKWNRFEGSVAICQPTGGKAYDSPPLTFEVIGDNGLLWTSSKVTTFDQPQSFSINIPYVKQLRLRVNCPGRSDLARTVWVEPKLQPPHLVHVDEFNDPRIGLPRDVNVPHDPGRGRSDGVFFVYSPGGWHAFGIHGIRSDGTCEVVARVLSEDPRKTAASLVIVSSGCSLLLIPSVKNVSDVPRQGRNSIIVAAVAGALHFRIFDRDGKLVVEIDEKALGAQTRQIEDLKRQLVGLWPPHELTRSEKGRVVTAVTSIVGHDPTGKLAGRGFLVKINLKGELFLEPSPWQDADAFHKIDPKIGPIIHSAIKPGNEFNKLLLLMKKREVVIFVNGVQVCDPVRFDYDVTPAGLSFGAAGPGMKRAELDRVEIREMVAHDEAPAKVEAAPPVKAVDAKPAATAKSKPAVRLNPPKLIAKSVGMALNLIPGGGFMMGSTGDDKDAAARETPQHMARISPFYLGVTEVTQAQYKAVMGNNPSHFSATGDGKDKVAGRSTDQFPVEFVSWLDATQFCDRLSENEGRNPLYGKRDKKQDQADKSPGYRLPTEAEWEYACRAGTTTRFYFGEGPAREYGWYFATAAGMTHPVGEKHPNGLGLYDMHGNVAEWCSDWFDHTYYQRTPPNDPQGPAVGSQRVIRGGNWRDRQPGLRSADRDDGAPGERAIGLGFRVALGPPPH